MAQDKSVSNFAGSMNLSTDSLNNPKNSYSYALNAIKEDPINNPTIISNEKGFKEYLNLGYTYVLLGSIYLGKKDYILFIKNLDNSGTKFNRIIKVSDGSQKVVLDADLGFNTNFPIKGTYRINYKNEIIIYWVDGLNDDRILNIDDLSYNGTTDSLALDIKYVPAILKSKTVNDTEGALKTGAYEFFASYESDDGAKTPWFTLTANPVYIIASNVSNPTLGDYVNITGVDSDIITSKSIKLSITNVDTNFKKIRLAIIKTVKGTSTAYYLDGRDISSNNIDITYSGFETHYQLSSPAELTVDSVKYYAANAIAQYGGRLLRANIKEAKLNINYQKFANNIKVSYYTERDLMTSMRDTIDYDERMQWWNAAATKYTDKKSLLRDEVYSLGIAFGLKKEGIETEVYHIPGRALNDIPDLQYVRSTPQVYPVNQWDNATVIVEGKEYRRWQVESTAAKNVNAGVYKLGYYESEESYPEGYDYPTGKIRHHKMPSSGVEPIFTAERQDDERIYIYRNLLGLKFENIVIPDELKGNIAYIRFYVSPRNTLQNKSIIAKGAFVDCSVSKINPNNDKDQVSDAYYVHPHQPYNDSDDPLNAATYFQEDHNEENQYESFHSPDTSLANPLLNVDTLYVENEIRGYVHYLRVQSEKASNKLRSDAGGFVKDIFYPNNNGALVPTGNTQTGAAYNLDNKGEDFNNIFRVTYKSLCVFNKITGTGSKFLKPIKRAAYVPFNANLSTDQLGGMSNPYFGPYAASNVMIELSSPLGSPSYTDTSVDFIDNNFVEDIRYGIDRGKTFHHHVSPYNEAVYRYGSIKNSNRSQYGNFQDLQYLPTDLVVANPSFDINNTLIGEVKGLIGDCYIDMFSVKRTRYTNGKHHYTYWGYPEVHVGMSSFISEAQVNHRLRYAEGTDEKVYYPKVAADKGIEGYLNDFKLVVYNDNYFKYNPDFHKQSSKIAFAVTKKIEDADDISFGTRIVYSEKLLDESKEDSYRKSLANNYRDLPKNKGNISHLFTKGQELYATTRDSLWKVFASNQTIKSESGDNITVGTGEFLALDPVELSSIEGGYAGCSSKFGMVETPYGYFYCDRYKGRFILFSDQMKDIALKDVTEYIRDNFELEITKQMKSLDSDFDNPLSNYGYIVGYEPETYRILITKTDFRFLPETIQNYKGEYDPNKTYQSGDIYLRDGQFYVYTTSVDSYKTIAQSSDLSDFVQSTIDAPSISFGTASNLQVQPNPADPNTVIMIPSNNFIGTTNFSYTSNCTTGQVNVTVIDYPDVPNYTFSVNENVPVDTIVGGLIVSYGKPISSYVIESGNTFGIFKINNNGTISVANNANLDYDKVRQQVLKIRITTEDSVVVYSTVTINISKVIGNPIGKDKTVTIDYQNYTNPVATIDAADYPNPPSPASAVDYSTVTVPDIFDVNLDAMTISVKEGATITKSTYSIVLRAFDFNDTDRFDDFTITIKTGYPEVQVPKWVVDESSAYCENQNITINNFDHLVFRADWEYPQNGKDLDIMVCFEGTGTPIDGVAVGFKQPNPANNTSIDTVPADINPKSDAYLWWALDDTNPVDNVETSDHGTEAVLLGIRKFINDYPNAPETISVAFYLVWYAIKNDGNVTIDVATYKGGTMSIDGTNIINTGGTQVSSDSRVTNVDKLGTTAMKENAKKVAILRYNKTTDSATLELL